MSAADSDAIALVAMLRHRVDGERRCKCEECRALKRVVALAREAVRFRPVEVVYDGGGKCPMCGLRELPRRNKKDVPVELDERDAR